MSNYLLGAVVASLALLACAPYASADEPTFEATLAGGVRFGGDFDDLDAPNNTGDSHRLGSSSTVGVILNYQQSPGAYYELLYGKQNASVQSTSRFDLSVEYFHLGGHLEFAEPDDRIVPYFALTLGVTRFAPRHGDYQDLTDPSLALSGGAKFRLTKHFALRADARGFATLVDGSGKVFCVSDANGLDCRFTFKGKTFVQGQALLGATLQF